MDSLPARSVADSGGDLGIDLDSGLESLADKSLISIEPDGSGRSPCTNHCQVLASSHPTRTDAPAD
jgi:hypothetical protein